MSLADRVLERLPGSPKPQDPFEPYMPAVYGLADVDGFFGELRRRMAEPENLSGATGPGERELALVMAPTRSVVVQPVGRPADQGMVEGAERMFGTGSTLDITVVSYTEYDAFQSDETMTRCVPFLGILMGLAFVGHRVVVFEGHKSAFEAGLRGSDVLIVDSAMAPFLQPDWHAVAASALNPDGRIYLHDRELFALRPVVADDEAEKGWQATEPDDEGSYANCLLSALALAPVSQVTLRSDRPLPDLMELTGGPAELGWIWRTPFARDRLDVQTVMDILVKNSTKALFSRSRTLRTLLVRGASRVEAVFKIVDSRSEDGVRTMQVRRG